MSQRLLEGRTEYVETVSDTQRIDELESRLGEVEHAQSVVKRDAVVALLSLLSQALRQVASGKIDLDSIQTEAPAGKWESIKKRLPPKQAAAIDIFLAQGSLKRTQLAAAMRMDYSNCTKNVIAVLVRQGLLIESGGLLSLKDL